VTGSIDDLVDRNGAAAFIWCWLALPPIVVPAIVAWTQRSVRREMRGYVPASMARSVGYPALFLLLVVVPCIVANILLVPALLDAHPAARRLLALPLAAVDWVAANGMVVSFALLLTWPAWIVVAALLEARRWRAPRTSPGVPGPRTHVATWIAHAAVFLAPIGLLVTRG